MKPTIFFFIFILLSLSTSAFDCNVFVGFDRDNCISLNDVDENLIANLIYKNSSYPDYDFIEEYNEEIEVDEPPEGYELHEEDSIKDAWLSILTVEPSIQYNNYIYVDDNVQLRYEYDYRIEVPQDYYSSRQREGRTCRIRYNLHRDSASLSITSNYVRVGTEKISEFDIYRDSLLRATVDIDSTIRRRTYKWREECCDWYRHQCREYCFRCRHERTDYLTDSLEIHDSIDVKHYEHTPEVEFTLVGEYTGTTKGILSKDNLTSVAVNFNNAFYKESEFVYSANFSKKPYYFLTLVADAQHSRASRNLIRNNYTFYVGDMESCSVAYSDFFSQGTEECIEDYSEEEFDDFTKQEFSKSWNFAFVIAVFIFINILIFKAIRITWGKALMPMILLLMFVPFVSAEDECGIMNLATCIPEKIFDFTLDLLNAPLEPLLSLIRTLLESPPNIEIFQGIWGIIIYCISLFYGLLFIYSGFQFLFSGHNVIRREMAKQWLKNTVIMIVLIQASFYLYGLILELGSVMTSSILTMVEPEFFRITADNLINVGLEFLFISFYVIVLLITLLFLTIRYLIVAFGVLFAPIGIFCYFIPPLRSYGKLILGILGMNIFITFFSAVIILACSQLIDIELFANIKIIVMITCFMILNLLFIILTKHIISKSSMGEGADKMAEAAKYIVMFL